jgi:hypothetical protein
MIYLFNIQHLIAIKKLAQRLRIFEFNHIHFFIGQNPLQPLIKNEDVFQLSARQMHCTENLIQIFPEIKLCGLVPILYVYVSVNVLYIPTIGPQTQYSKIGGPIMDIFKSLTDTWMQKFGTRPCSFISRNICFQFSVHSVTSSHLTVWCNDTDFFKMRIAGKN